jgi:hypothetical protein
MLKSCHEKHFSSQSRLDTNTNSAENNKKALKIFKAKMYESEQLQNRRCNFAARIILAANSSMDLCVVLM